jgi:hypothetical protein
MSDEILALILTFAVIAFLFLWVPMLNIVCPPCGRFLARHRLQRMSGKEPSSVTPIQD